MYIYLYVYKYLVRENDLRRSFAFGRSQIIRHFKGYGPNWAFSAVPLLRRSQIIGHFRGYGPNWAFSAVPLLGGIIASPTHDQSLYCRLGMQK